MSKRWYVFKGEHKFGPFSGAEIRQGLRSGEFDPFDPVSAEGSHVRRELVEVDAIFADEGELSPSDISVVIPGSRQGQFASTAALQQAAFDQSQDQAGHTVVKAHPSSSASSDTKFGQQTAEHTQMQSAQSSSPNAGYASRRKELKRFYLIDRKKRILGPVSAAEVQSLFYKGILTNDVMVSKRGGDSLVSVQKFVSVYAERQGRKKGRASRPRSMAPSKIMQDWALDQQVRAFSGSPILPWISFSLLLMAIVFAGFAVYDHLERPNETIHGQSPSKSVPTKRLRAPRSKFRQSDRRDSELASDRAARRPQASRPKPQASTTRKSVRRQPTQMRRSSAPRWRSTRNSTSSSRRPAARPVPARLVTQRPTARASIRPASVAPSRRLSNSRPSSGPQISTLRSGQNVSGLGPMAFDRAAVERCQVKCSIGMVGAGGSVSVKFFKQHWGPSLLAKPGRVYISGLVQKEGKATTILLNGVR